MFFLSSNDWRTWENSAFRKTPLFKNCTSERLSLPFISKVEIYNPLPALLLTLVCHLYNLLLRVANFALNVAIATDFQRTQTELSTKALLWKIYRCKVVQFFTAQALLLTTSRSTTCTSKRPCHTLLLCTQMTTGRPATSRYSPFEKDPSKPEPSVTFPTSLPPRSLFQANLKRTRNSSAPGPNRIPYLVWKRCPSLQQRLYTVCCKVWQQAQIPTSWRQAIIVLVHKRGDQNNPANFRPIALSNCDSKILFSLVASVTTTYMRSNNYFDGLTQKGFLPKMSGCVEHASLSWEALRDAKENHRSICFAWLDLKNAFGSVRHMLIRHCLRLQVYHFPAHFCKLVFSYYEMMTAKISIGNGSSLQSGFSKVVYHHQFCSISAFSLCLTPCTRPLAKKAGHTPFHRMRASAEMSRLMLMT